jgi:hypothetical protein
MGDGPDRSKMRNAGAKQPVPLNWHSTGATPKQQQACKYVYDNIETTTSHQGYSDGNVAIFILCGKCDIPLSFYTDPMHKTVNVYCCSQCLQEKKEEYPLNEQYQNQALVSNGLVNVFIQHTAKDDKTKKILHFVVTTPAQKVAKFINFYDPVLSCTTCKAYDDYLKREAAQEAQDNKNKKKRKPGKEEVHSGDDKVLMLKQIRDIFVNEMNKSDHSVFLNGTLVPTSVEKAFHNSVLTEQKLLSVLKRRVSRVEQECKIKEQELKTQQEAFQVCQEIFRRFRNITLTSTPSEQKLLMLWSIFNEIENDPMGLQEARLDSIVLKQVIQPAKETILSDLSSNTKNAIRFKPSNTFAFVPMNHQASTGSNSSVSSYNGSVSSSSSSSYSMEISRMRPPPLPNSSEVPPALPDIADVEIKVREEDPPDDNKQDPPSPFPGQIEVDDDLQDMMLQSSIMDASWGADLDDYGSPLQNPI